VSADGPTVASLANAILDEVERAVVGKRDALELVLLGFIADGHVLIEDFPGLAKTLIARSFAQAFDMAFARIQFTPDLMPSDVTGSSIFNQRSGDFEFRPGPIFTNLLLGDEINRAPPKTQAALLEAMQERQVTIEGRTNTLERPFLVIATQNPIEYEGTYPLPEAQLDRFLFRIDVGYPDEAGERAILRLAHRGVRPPSLGAIERVASAGDLEAAGALIDATTISDEVAGYLASVIRASRELPSVELGASPRAAVHLLAAARAAARLAGRAYVTPDDVVAMAVPVLAHRLVLRPEAELERLTSATAVAAAIAAVAVPR
jgi:MoxR-like ATPase